MKHLFSKKCLMFLFVFIMGAGFAQAQMYVSGNKLYDKCGEQVIIRGIEHVINLDGWAANQNGDHLDDIASTGTNSIRILGGTDVSAADLDDLLHRAINVHNMWVNIAHIGWDDAAKRDVIKQYEDFVILHAQGEVNHSDNEKWRDDSKAVIDKFRGEYGFKCPLDLMANEYGQNLEVVKQYGQEIFNYDPEKNIIFGVQFYSKYGTDPRSKMDEAAALDVPVQAGATLFNEGIYNGWGNDADTYKKVWDRSHELGMGCMYWMWWGDDNQMVTDGNDISTLTSEGDYLLNQSPYKMSSTAVKSYFLNNKVCESTGVITVTGVTVSPSSAEVTVGVTTNLLATVTPSNATNKNVSWSTSSSSVATVNSNGTVTGISEGTATITATAEDGGFQASSTVTVLPAADLSVTARGQNTPNEGIDKLTDGDINSKWLDFSATSWVEFEYTTAKSWNGYDITSGNDAPERDPKNWTIQGSNDGSSWTTLDTRSGQTWASRNQTRTFSFNNATAYKYYKWNITANGSGDIIQTSEFTPVIGVSEDLTPTANAGSDKSITLPTNSVSVSDASASGGDGTLSYSWSETTSLGSSISNGSGLTPTFSDLVEGTYTFELTVTDADGDVATDQMTVTVNPAEGGGGDDQTLTVTARGENTPNEGIDELTDGDLYTKWLDFSATSWVEFEYGTATTWTGYDITSGNDAPERDPKNWTIQGSNDGSDWTTIDTRSGESWASRNQTRSFTFTNSTAYKYYKWNITANGSGNIIQASEFTPVTGSNGGGSGTDLTPTANAGSDKSITLPTNSVSVSDASASGGDGTLSYSWSENTSLGSTISNGTSLSPTFSNLMEGIYTFELTVTDEDGDVATDQMTVTVNPEEGGGGDPITETIDSEDSRISYSGSWGLSSNDADYEGSVRENNCNGSASLTFTGTSIEVIGRKASWGASANIIIDGSQNQTVSFNASNQQYQQTIATITGLSDGEHTIVVENTSCGSYVFVDAFIVNPSSLKSLETNQDMTFTGDMNKADFEISLYPNPAQNYVNLSVDGELSPNAKVSILNMVGATILKYNMPQSNTIQIDASALNPGIYFLNVTSERGVVSEKLIVK